MFCCHGFHMYGMKDYVLLTVECYYDNTILPGKIMSILSCFPRNLDIYWVSLKADEQYETDLKLDKWKNTCILPW
jgi:hypothetical protein